LDQMEPNTPFYNIPQMMSIKGNLKVEVLREALNTIVARHESLRTTFTEDDGSPTQIISDDLEIELPVKDLTHLPESDRENEARILANEEAKTPFDLVTGPLIRASLVRLSDDHHILLLTMHHIVSDGWSLGILTRELASLYGAFSAGKPSPLS